MGNYDMTLRINSDALMGMRNDADVTLQRLLKSMVEKNSTEASVTIKLDIELCNEWIPDFKAAPNEDGSVRKRRIIKPIIEHKISSVLKIENRCNGENSFEDYELVLDEELGEFVLRPIANTEQQSMFDDQYQENMSAPDEAIDAVGKFLEATAPMLLEQHEPEEDEFGEEIDEFGDPVVIAENVLPEEELGEDEEDEEEFEDFDEEFD